MACRQDIKTAVLSKVYTNYIEGRPTYGKIEDGLFIITSQKYTKGKSKAATLTQALHIARELRTLIVKDFGNNLEVNIIPPEFVGIPVQVRVAPTYEYIEKLFSQIDPDKRTEFVSREGFLQNPNLLERQILEELETKFIPQADFIAQQIRKETDFIIYNDFRRTFFQDQALYEQELAEDQYLRLAKKLPPPILGAKGQYKLFSKVDKEEVELLTETVAADLFNFLKEKTGLAGNVINDKSQKFKGAVINGVPTINVAYAELSDGFHEYLHPVMMSLRVSNPKLFNKLYNDLKSLPQWKTIADKTLDRVQKLYPELKNIDDFIEEALVTALGYASELKSNKQLETVKSNRPFLDWANNFYKWLTEFLQGLFINTVDLSRVGLNTTLENIVEWMTDTKTRILLAENWQTLVNREENIDKQLEVTEVDTLNSLSNSLLSELVRVDKTETLEEYINKWVEKKFKLRQKEYVPKKFDRESFAYKEAQNLIATIATSGYNLNTEEIKKLPESTYQKLAQVIEQLDLSFKFSLWLDKKGNTVIALNSPFKPDNVPSAEIVAVDQFRKFLLEKYPEKKSLPANEIAIEYKTWAQENYGLNVTDATGYESYGLSRLTTSSTKNKNYTRKLFLDDYLIKQGHTFQLTSEVTGNGLGWYASVDINNDGFDHEFQSDVLPEINKSYKKDEYKSQTYQLKTSSARELAEMVARNKVQKELSFSLDSKIANVLNNDFDFSMDLDVVKNYLISEIDVSKEQSLMYGKVSSTLLGWKLTNKIILTLKFPKSENFKQLESWINKYIIIETAKESEFLENRKLETEMVDLPFSKIAKKIFLMSKKDTDNFHHSYYLSPEGFTNLPEFLKIEVDRHNAWHQSKDPLRPDMPATISTLAVVFGPHVHSLNIATLYPYSTKKLRNYWQLSSRLSNVYSVASDQITKTFNKYKKAKKILSGSDFRKKLYEDTNNIVKIQQYWKNQYERFLSFYTKEYEFVKQEAQNQLTEKSSENREQFYKKYVDIYKKWFDITIQHSVNTRKLQGRNYYYLPTSQAMELIEGNTIAAPLYRSIFEVNKELTNYTRHTLAGYIQQNTQETTTEIQKYWPQIHTVINQDSTVFDIADALIANTDFVNKSESYKDYASKEVALAKVSSVGPFYTALSKFAKKNNIKLTYEQPDWSKAALIKVDLTNYEYKPIDRFSKVIPTAIEKPSDKKIEEFNELTSIPEVRGEIYFQTKNCK